MVNSTCDRIKIAKILRHVGLQIEGPVAIVLNRSIEFVVAALGVLKAGGSYLPLDPDASPQRLAQLMIQSGAQVALTTTNLRSRLSEWRGKIFELDARAPNEFLEIQSDPGTQFTAVGADPSRRAYLICTSGSTGAPKIVEIEHHSLTNLVCHYQRYLKLTTNDRASWLSPPAFDASIADIWPVLCTGGIIVIPEGQLVTNPAA